MAGAGLAHHDAVEPIVGVQHGEVGDHSAQLGKLRQQRHVAALPEHRQDDLGLGVVRVQDPDDDVSARGLEGRARVARLHLQGVGLVGVAVQGLGYSQLRGRKEIWISDCPPLVLSPFCFVFVWEVKRLGTVQ